MTEEELKAAELKRDEALARATEANEEAQRIDKDNADRRQAGLDFDASNESLEKENKKLLADREGAAEELAEIRAELDKDKSELKKVKSALDDIKTKRDAENTQFNQEVIEHTARKRAMDDEYTNTRLSYDNELADIQSEIAIAQTKKESLESINDALEAEIKENRTVIDDMQKRHNQLVTNLKTIGENTTIAEKNLDKVNEQITDAARELDTSAVAIKAKQTELQKVTDEYEEKKYELFSISNAREALDQRERDLKDAYKKAGLVYPEK